MNINLHQTLVLLIVADVAHQMLYMIDVVIQNHILIVDVEVDQRGVVNAKEKKFIFYGKKIVLKSFNDFLKENKKNINITAKHYTHNEFIELMKPIMCDLCRRLFNPSDKERVQAKKNVKEINELTDDFYWEVITKK